MICISEVIEGLEEEFNCASFSGEDHRHTALQGTIGSWCCSLWSCSCSCSRSWSSSSTTASSSATASTTSLSSWLCLWLLRGWLLRGLLDLSASTSSCNCCCCHCYDRGS